MRWFIYRTPLDVLLSDFSQHHRMKAERNKTKEQREKKERIKRRSSGGLTQCGWTEGHDTIEGERSSFKLHVFVAGLHLHSSLS